ncbi:protein ligase MYCBP2 [Seminavis robusta]|uniref:Protein ligase MYCBP2 n=1 Tax=Seminavis robusta TaxID=568900 RepID=A0A9N8HNJ2_9STRA|nr:protein ligase MYCBP2 [Seminavis robusta]|eukprot:Sro1089_g240060.1 protein ligase MYCBP2 (473) ;mRNA; f:13444-14862
MATFQDESTDCAICLGLLSDPEMEVIELTTCGHRWHLECLKEQLAQAQPNPAQRLVLTGCRCAKCGSVCEHPKLEHLTRQTDALREKVDAVIREQLEDKSKNDLAALEDARRKYAVYLCSHCREPYFGGTIACADTAEGEVPPDERLCVACAPQQQQQAQCRHPLEHRGHHIWKCRYCCKVATHICYGTVHFCDDCHDRNSERVEMIRRQQLRQRETRTTDHQPPSCLSPIPCPGGDACPFPKKEGQTHHENGKAASCEQAYGCGWCQSNPTANEHAFVAPPGSRNFLQNGCGQHGHRGWQQFNPRARWQVEQSDTPLSDTITTNFVSSFQWSAMGQSVVLSSFLQSNELRLPLEVSAKYMARTDCASVFRMEALLLGRNRAVLQRKRTNTLNAPADFWERASLTLEPMAGAYEVAIVVYGKDVPFWQGNFGSKVTDCQIRVLGTPEELQRDLRPENEIRARAGGETTIGSA